MQLQHIDIARLHVSPLNMRHAKREPDVSDILPSVKARGKSKLTNDCHHTQKPRVYCIYAPEVFTSIIRCKYAFRL